MTAIIAGPARGGARAFAMPQSLAREDKLRAQALP
jgi:hypothetical protein